ncbi:hypothetical protein [Mycolicibacterium iranicum]|uniref:Uncharacterized protein n=1 Tax=Mycolicibacterium iranicum TaxID=912594 RepID=A0ABT4HIG1_MYCIR|nr:hypothetical protein [Mycolicibacterium iranicum]MCZ0729988.1 hypothetical protein [Mycolicibacterium iranicum]
MVSELTAREKLLVEGRNDWVKLWEVHRNVALENTSATLDEVQSKTIDIVRALISEGLAEVGELRDHGARFEPWTTTADESARRLEAEYVDGFNERDGWPWTLWLRITEEGKRIGDLNESAYRDWLSKIRKQGTEDQALPLKFEPRP